MRVTVQHPVLESGRPVDQLAAVVISIKGEFAPKAVADIIKRLDHNGDVRILAGTMALFVRARIGSIIDGKISQVGGVVIRARLTVCPDDRQKILIYVVNANPGRPIARSGDVRDQAERAVNLIQKTFSEKAPPKKM